MNKKLIIPVATLLTLGLIAYGTTKAYADSETESPPFVQRFSQKLGLSEEKVQGAMDEMREEKQLQMQNRFEERLSAAVQNGDITEDQKQMILSKHEELRQERLGQREELEAWANENGIDLQFLHMGMGHGMKGGFGGFPK